MSLRGRLTLAIVLLVGITVFFSWLVAARGIVHPFARKVFESHVAEAVQIAEELESGQEPRRVMRAHGVRIRPADGPPKQGSPERSRRWVNHELDGYQVAWRTNRRNEIYVLTNKDWVVVKREALDLERPGRRLGPLLLGVALTVIALASWLGFTSLGPWTTATDAMKRIADGELDHRLPPSKVKELNQLSESFNSMADRIDGMLRREKELMAAISHELRTPLTRLRLEVEILRDSEVPTSRLDAMEGDLTELEGLIQELVQLSRLELGQELQIEDVDLGGLAREVFADVKGEGAVIRGDRRLLQRALDNLRSNAERYAPESPIEVAVDGTRITVADRGPGVAPDALERLFEPFYRTEGSRNKGTGGLGLGLMIVQRVAQSHGGTASAHNREGGGLEIVLELPGARESA